MQAELLDKIARTKKRKEKESLLRKADEETQRMLKYALDPALMFCLSRKVEDVELQDSDPEFWSKFKDLLDSLHQKEISGSRANLKLEDLLESAPTKQDAKWAIRVLNKNLKAGLAAGTVNRVFPNLIPTFEVSLPTTFDAKRHLPLRGEWYVEPQVGGLRLVIIDGRAYTRNGKPVESIDKVIYDLSQHLDLSECVVDGEAVLPNVGSEKLGHILTTNSSVPDVEFHVYDLILRENWDKKNTRPLYKRKETLRKLLRESSSVKVVSWYTVPPNSTESELHTFTSVFADRGHSGCYLKDASAKYSFAKGKDFLRLRWQE